MSLLASDPCKFASNLAYYYTTRGICENRSVPLYTVYICIAIWLLQIITSIRKKLYLSLIRRKKSQYFTQDVLFF